MSTLVKTPESEVIIRFSDCDPFNHLTNSRYIDYFANAREDHLMTHYDFNPFQLVQEKGLGWVAVQNQIAYLKPAIPLERVIIDSTLLRWGTKSILVEMRMWDLPKQQLKSVLWMTLVHYNLRTQKSEPHGEALTGLFASLENPLPQPMHFDERVKQLNPSVLASAQLKTEVMKQLTYIKKNTLQWWDVPEPTLESPRDAIVRPLAAARCDGDKVFLFHNFTRLMQIGAGLHYLDPATLHLLGDKPFGGPFPVGHECVAEVVSCGEEVTTFQRGDRVVVPFAISCGSCLHCQSGLTSKCSKAGDTFLSAYSFGEAMGSWGGMISDLVRVPFADHMLVAIPKNVDPISLASASDNIPDAWRTVAPLLKNTPGAPVLIVGGGAESIGLYAAGIAIALGATEVRYVDYNQTRLDIAERLGADPVAIPGKQKGRWYRKHAPEIGGRYPIAVDASANPDGLRYALRSLAPGGTCTSVGYYFQKGTSIPLMQMYANDSTLHTGIAHPRSNPAGNFGLDRA